MAEPTLAQRVRSKYPGEYDDMDDAALEAAIDRKYPGEYDDIPRTTAGQPAPAAPGSADSGGLLGAAKNTAIGVGKGLTNTALGLTELINQGTAAVGLSQPIKPEVFARARGDLATPEGTAQNVGFHGEQIGEFFVPVAGAVGKAKKAIDIGRAALLGRAQTGSNTQGAISGALTATVPMVGKAAGAASRWMGGSAERSMARALGATKEWAKAEGQAIAPEMLKRGVGGTRAGMQATATAESKQVGQKIGAEIQQAAQQGVTIPGASIASDLSVARADLMVRNASRQMVPIPGTEGVIRRLDKLEEFVTSLGPDIPIDKAAKIKTTLDRIVSKAGLYGQKQGATATDAANAWATREAASGFRSMLNNANPTLEALNKEYAFWKGLKDVLKSTELRTQAQSSGLGNIAMVTVGGGAGFASGEGMGDRLQNALVGAAGAKLLTAFRSPWWQSKASGPFKHMLEKALASGSSTGLNEAITKLTAAMPARYRNVEEPE